MQTCIKPSWDEYFLGMLEAIGRRASCDRGRSAAVLVKNNRIISTGYVGAPTGLPSCDEVGHLIERRSLLIGSDLHKTGEPYSDRIEISEHCVRTFHAEMNAILSCAKEGVSTVGATMYCTMVPCRNCAMAIIQAGIIRVVAMNAYHKGQDAFDMFKQTNIDIKVINQSYLY